MLFRLQCLALAATAATQFFLPAAEKSPPPDRYPDAHALLLEAAAALPNRKPASIANDPRYAIAASLLRAGYIEEARRLQPFSGPMPYQTLIAEILYGDLASARRTVAAIPEVKGKIAQLLTIANTAWRMRDRPTVDQFLKEAQQLATAIANPLLRQKQLQIVALRRSWFSQESPVLLSATPTPPAHRPAAPPPEFPITPAGFRHRPAATRRSASVPDENVTRIYALMSAHNEAGLRDYVKHAAIPYQQTLGLAALAQLDLQARSLALAEEAARAMPEDHADCSLAKAEAFVSVASAWAQSGDLDGARNNFALARSLLEPVATRELVYGKAVVTGFLAAAEDRAGLASEAAIAYEAALALNAHLPPTTDPDPYRRLFAAALEAQDLAMARRIAQAWRAKAGPAADPAIATAWFNGHQHAAALTSARAIPNLWQRAEVLAGFASHMLDEAGAPNP